VPDLDLSPDDIVDTYVTLRSRFLRIDSEQWQINEDKKAHRPSAQTMGSSMQASALYFEASPVLPV
jgi:hypothetical protein